MPVSWPDIIGFAGVALIIGAYLALQVGRLASQSILYSVMNGLGAAGVIVSLVYDFNISAFVVELFWLLISVFGLVRALNRRKTTPDATITQE